ncbi:MAG: hypothetical protein JO219_03235 [Candidatus Eremiobacteraeota bacterium]|nr:hypothetical protein [Candidatus Eremiobacteraeota bacterium]
MAWTPLVVWFWVAVVAATSIYTFVTLVSDAKIDLEPNVTYAERYSASIRGLSSGFGFFALGDFIGASVMYQAHGHLVDWELTPLLVRWPLVLFELLLLFGVAAALSTLTALIPARIRIHWLAVGIALFVVGAIHGLTAPLKSEAIDSIARVYVIFWPR